MPKLSAYPLHICIFGATAPSAAALERIIARIPTGASVVLLDACAKVAGLSNAVRFIDADVGDNPLAALAFVARACPPGHLILLRGDTHLPEYACERLLRALECPNVLLAMPLNNMNFEHSALPTGAVSDADSERIDALCYAYGARTLIDTSTLVAPVSAWHGERLTSCRLDSLHDPAALQTQGLRAVILDHLYIAADDKPLQGPPPDSDPRDPAPPSSLAALRERIAAALTSALAPGRYGLDKKPVLLHVLHGWGGGAKRWVEDFAATFEEAHHLVLIARGSPNRHRHGEWLELYDGKVSDPPLRRWPLPMPIADTAISEPTYRTLLDTILREFCVDTILVSSLIGHSLDALRTGLPTAHIVHDHYPLWPVLHRDFGDPSLRFDNAQRQADLTAAGNDYEFANRDPQHWQRLREAFVTASRDTRATLIAPSHSALANELRLAPELTDLPHYVIPHGLKPWTRQPPPFSTPMQQERLRLLLPGRIRRGKGAELLTAVLPKLREYADLFLIGSGSDAHLLFGQANVHILLDYQRDELPEIIARIAPDAALLLPTVSETFSYTLSELRSLNLPVIATRLGALAERIEEGVDGFLVDPYPDAIVARIAELAGNRSVLSRVSTTLMTRKETTLPQMAYAYSKTLHLKSRAPVRYALNELSAKELETSAYVQLLTQLMGQKRQLSQELTAQREEASKRGEWGHQLNHEVKRAQAQNKILHNELTIKDTELETRATLLKALDAVLATQDTELQTRNAELKAKNAELKARNIDISVLQAEFDERTRWALQLDAERQNLIRLRDEILASTSWRFTKPLRAITKPYRTARTALRFRVARLRSLQHRLLGSLARRGVRGTWERIAQEFRNPEPIVTHVAAPPSAADFIPFALPTSEAPRISIVIPVYNKMAYTTACLRSVAEHAGAVPFEVIVIDDGSSDETPECLANISGIRVIRNVKNLGFIGSCNAGAEIAQGEFLLFLNNDTVVTTGWLEALARCFEEEPEAGMVGAKLIYPDGRLQEAGGIIFSDGSGWNYGRFDDPADSRYNFRREADYCSGAAIMLRNDLFKRLGNFDIRYAPAYYEDTDLAFAVRNAGLKVFYEPQATVIHFEGVTSGTDTSNGIKSYQVTNRQKFLGKWKDDLLRQPDSNVSILRAATHRAAKRVLIIDATTATPDQDSGSLRMVNFMRVLRELGCQISFLPDNRAFIPRYTVALQALGVEVLYHPFVSDPVALFRERGSEWDLIVLSRHYIAISYLDLARLYAPQAKLVFDTVDLHYLREQRAAELENKPELAQRAMITEAQELKLMRECDVTLVVSPVEQQLLARVLPGVRVDILSNVHEVYGCRKPFANRQDLVFVGGFQHPPNTDAVIWFIDAIFPLVRAELPDIRFHIIGSKVPTEIKALANDHVMVHGYIEDITPYMDECRISVAPLRYGAGVKGKINMAMSYGLPVVSTPIGIEGMHVRCGEEILVGNDAVAFADAIIQLYRDEALWNRLSANGLENVRQHFSFDAAKKAITQILM